KEGQDNSPVFKRFNTGFSYDKGGIITHFVIANSNAFIIIDKNRILMYKNFPFQTSTREEFDLLSKNVRVNEIFVHPYGCHVILYTEFFNLLYFHIDSAQLISVTKHKLTASTICWNYQTNNLSKCILIGTYDGIIYELEADFTTLTPIKAFPHSLVKVSISTHYLQDYNLAFVFVATPQNHFRFMAPMSSFEPYSLPLFLVLQDKNRIEIPCNKSYGHLCVFPTYSEYPTHFSWLTGYIFYLKIESGVMIGEIDIDPNHNKIDLKHKRFLQSTINSEEVPLSVHLTAYHCVLLYPNRFVAINLINEEIACNDLLGLYHGVPKQLVWDGINNNLWYFTSTNIFGCHIWNEDRKIWKILLEKKDFKNALKLTENNPKNHDLVNQRIAYDYLINKEYMKAAELYASTNAYFEPTVMHFIDLDSKYLIEYLTRKLVFYKNDLIQKHIIIMWIIDSYLIELCNEDNKIAVLKCQLKTFLRWSLVKKSIEQYPNVYYKIIEHYGAGDFVIFIANLLNDSEKIIIYHLNHDEYFDAFERLKKQKEPKLWYKLSHIFFVIMPDEVIECWKEMSHILDSKLLIQGILHLNLTSKFNLRQCIINYLEYCIETLHSEESFIHNYIISFYCISLQNDKNDIFHSKECANKAPDIFTKRKLWLIIAKHTLTPQMDIEIAKKFLEEASVLKFEDLLPFFGDFNKIDTFKEAICESLKSYGNLVKNQKQEIQVIQNNCLTFIGRRSTHIDKNSKCSLCTDAILTKPFYTFPCGHSFHQICYIKTYFNLSSFTKKKIIYQFIFQFTISSMETSIQPISTYTTETCFVAKKYFEEMLQTYEAIFYSQESLHKDKEVIKKKIDELMTHECIFCGNFSIRNINESLVHGTGFLDIVVDYFNKNVGLYLPNHQPLNISFVQSKKLLKSQVMKIDVLVTVYSLIMENTTINI
ncbi:hypothetical protein HZS_3307, partial [Henneguya salminicola]